MTLHLYVYRKDGQIDKAEKPPSKAFSVSSSGWAQTEGLQLCVGTAERDC
jgi:hypothetical protein